MTQSTDAYLSLMAAMDDNEPVCLGDDLFTADTVAKEDADFMATLCAACPLVTLCRAYAQLERPKAGFWAGKKYPTTNKKEN